MSFEDDPVEYKSNSIGLTLTFSCRPRVPESAKGARGPPYHTTVVFGALIPMREPGDLEHRVIRNPAPF